MTTDTAKKDASTEASKGKEEDSASKSLMEAIEEDDEFEEFSKAHWAANEEEAEDVQQWQDNWDDAMDDDFTKNLREELAKNSDGS
jgi:26 proteasome complex subunit DSS1